MRDPLIPLDQQCRIAAAEALFVTDTAARRPINLDGIREALGPETEGPEVLALVQRWMAKAAMREMLAGRPVDVRVGVRR